MFPAVRCPLSPALNVVQWAIPSRPDQADSAFVPASHTPQAAQYRKVPSTGVTLLKHLEKLPKPDARQRLRPAFVGT
jgi:hypothetical protein